MLIPGAAQSTELEQGSPGVFADALRSAYACSLIVIGKKDIVVYHDCELTIIVLSQNEPEHLRKLLGKKASRKKLEPFRKELRDKLKDDHQPSDEEIKLLHKAHHIIEDIIFDQSGFLRDDEEQEEVS